MSHSGLIADLSLVSTNICNPVYHCRYRRVLRRIARCFHSFSLVGVILLAVDSVYAADVAVPGESDWTDHGKVVAHGNQGAWDWRLGGGISPASMIRFNNKYIVYYIGASGNRNDNGPAFRALGAAWCDVTLDCTQADNWTKYNGNPILTHEVPSGCEEAGVFAATAAVKDGTVYLYYAAMTGFSPSGPGCTEVTEDIHLATSTDGLNFTNNPANPIISHLDSVYGGGDEMWPVAALYDPSAATWYLYYGMGGVPEAWNIGVAWGASPTNVGSGGNTKAFANDSKRLFSFSVVDTGDDYVSFRWQDEQVSANCPTVPVTPQWTVQIGDIAGSDPRTLASTRGPNNKYPYDALTNFTLGMVFFDSVTATWFLWHQDSCPLRNSWDSREGKDLFLRTAQSGVRPNPPTGLQVK